MAKRARKIVAAPTPSRSLPQVDGASVWKSRLSQLHPRRFFLETWRAIDDEAAAMRAARLADGKGYDYRPLVALTFGAICLASMEYFGHQSGPEYGWMVLTFEDVLRWLDPVESIVDPAINFAGEIRRSRWLELAGFGWWSAWRVLGYFVLPALLIKLAFRERVRDHGLATKGFREHAWIYGLAYLVVLICVIGVANYDQHFQEYYPFYSRASRSWVDFWSWELLYAAQFFSLEFFFRGFWLKAMKPTMGSYAIFAMVVPYCMIHFGKPFLETLAAIIAGVFLGTLSMKTRSIWSGFLIHVSVAISMDVAALLCTERGLPDRLWPL